MLIILDFSKQANPLFLKRDEWLRIATCVSAYGLLLVYLFTFVVFLFGINSLAKVTLFLFGFKSNAIFYYHTMEFSSATPPTNLLLYFAVELPYIIAIFYVVFRLAFSNLPFGQQKKQTNEKTFTHSKSK